MKSILILCLLLNFSLIKSTCKTPVECYTESIEILKNDRDEMRKTVEILNEKYQKDKEEMLKTIRALEDKGNNDKKEIISLINETKNREVRSRIKRTVHVLMDNISLDSKTSINNFKINVVRKTYAVIIKIFFIYNGAGNTHGYITGNLFQTDNKGNVDSYVTFNHAHFNWYYNHETVEYIVPWDSTKSEYIQIEITSSRNTNTQNFYSITHVGNLYMEEVNK